MSLLLDRTVANPMATTTNNYLTNHLLRTYYLNTKRKLSLIPASKDTLKNETILKSVYTMTLPTSNLK